MLERLENLPPDVTGIRAVGLVTKDDYASLVHPMLEQARQEGRRLRMLYQLGPMFVGFEPGAAWADARLGLQYLRRFERCAIVTDTPWVRDATHVMSALMPFPVRVFGPDEMDGAVAWLQKPVHSGLAHRFVPSGGVLVIEPSAPLRAEDFDALAADVDPWIEAHGSLDGLVLHMRTFPGWETFGALVRHVRFVRNHHRKVKRIAIAADGALPELAPMLADHFVAAELRHFAFDAFDDAVQWASGSTQTTVKANDSAARIR